MKIAILGGAFNPPHLGHELISYQLINFAQVSQVWLAPAFKHTFNKEMASVKHRANMAKMLTGHQIKYCHEEINNKLNGDTLKLMEILKKKYPQHQFYFVIGSDNLKKFKQWQSWEKLIINFPLLVFPRPEFKFDLKKYDLDNSKYKFILLKDPLLAITNISSTNIRQRIRKNLSIDHLVPEKVNQYIKTHHLY